MRFILRRVVARCRIVCARSLSVADPAYWATLLHNGTANTLCNGGNPGVSISEIAM
jgi:hypothetical protein